MESEPSIVTVILNTNRRDATLECLDSLNRCTCSRHQAIVLDNASTDGSVEAIREGHPQVEIVALTENRGYAGNNNVGIELALEKGADWVFVLNEDTVLDPECLQRLIEVGGGDRSIGIVGPMVYHHDDPDIIQSAGGRLSRYWESSHIAENERDQGRFVEPHEVDWISGCAIMVRREVFEDVGAIDERYFYYWEETEFCIRARRRGWRIVQIPRAKLWHKGVRIDYQPKPSVTYYATRNRLLTLSKHGAPFRVRLMAWVRIIRTLTSWSVRPKWKDRRSHRRAMRRGLQDFLLRRWGKMKD